MKQKKYFGTDGIRGQVGNSLINAEFMLKLGWAAGKVLGNKKDSVILIGKDTRISGYMIESALQAGLSAAGVNTQLLGPMPTPAIAYLTHSIRASAGIVISASHNPYQDNGVKFFDENGCKLSDDLENAIEAHIDMSMRTVSSDQVGKAWRLVDAPGRYIEFCKSTFPSNLNLKGLTIVLDCANGATYHIVPKIFHELGAETIVINDHPNGYNINKNCGATDTHPLQKAVFDYEADLGIAFDGDGDRVMMVDFRGERVDGDELLCILATDRLTGIGSKTGVVGTVMSNLGLEEALKEHGIAFERVAVGDRYVLERLKQNSWLLGGESSGHIVDLDYTTTGDGIITALHILRIIQVSGKPLHTLKKVMTKHPQVLINVPVVGVVNLAKCPEIDEAVIMAKKHLNGKGRIVLRPSGTEPVVRIMVEGEHAEVVKTIAEDLAKVVTRSINQTVT